MKPCKHNFKNRFRMIAILLTGFYISGCSLFRSPEPAALPPKIPAGWQTQVHASNLPVTASLLDLFNDDAIKKCVDEALANNPDLLATALRLKASQQRLVQTNAARLPAVSTTGSRGRNNNQLSEITGKPDSRNRYSLGLNITWEADIWGRLSDLHQQQQALHEIKRVEAFSAYDSLAARVIRAWINIAGTGQSLELQEERIKALQKIEDNIFDRYTEGLDNLDQLSTARTRTIVAKADISHLSENLAKHMRTLELLMGRFTKITDQDRITLPDIELPPVRSPLIHLKMRPDIQIALASVKADELSALAAHKARLPKISLSYDRSKTSATSGSFGGSDVLWSLIANMTAPVFEGGRLLSEARAAEFETQASVKALTATVLTALKEVENLLGLEQDLKTREVFLNRALEQAKKSTFYYRGRYETGLETIQTVLNAFEQEMDIKARLINIRAQRLGNRIDLALSLGISV